MYYTVGHQVTRQQRSMMVTGVGHAQMEPDAAQIDLEVVTTNSNLTSAQQLNATLVNQVIESLMKIGISKENITTSSYTVYPQYDYVEGKQQFRDYQVTNTITVEVMNIKETGAIIDVAIQNGVNTVSSLQFVVKNEESFYLEALHLALKNAVVKAKEISKTMQFKFDSTPIKITEEYREKPVQFKTFASKEITASTPIEPGQITIQSIVNVEFQY